MISRQNLNLVCTTSSRPTYGMGINAIETTLKVELHKMLKFLFSSLIPIVLVELVYIRVFIITEISFQVLVFIEKQFNFITFMPGQPSVKSISIIKVLSYLVWFTNRVFTLITKIEYRILILIIKLHYLPLVIRMYN